MITLDDDTLVLDRTQGGDDILPMLHSGRGERGDGWFIDVGVSGEAVLNFLLDAEILDESFPIVYIARNGRQADAVASVEELIAGPDGHMCRLRGIGPPPPVLLADEPKTL